MSFLGPKPGEKPEPFPSDVTAQSLPEDKDPGFVHVTVKIPKATYVALGKTAQLLRGESNDEVVAEFLLLAVESYIPTLLEHVETIKKAKSLLSVYPDA